MTPYVFVGLNCSMAPSPHSISSLLDAQREARVAGIFATIRVTQLSISGFLAGSGWASEVIKSDNYTHLLMCADDVWFPSHTIKQLVQDDKDVVSGVYRRRGDTKQVCAVLPDGEDVMKHIKAQDLTQSVVCPSHSMLIKREVLQKVWDAFPELEYKDDNENMVRAIFIPFVAGETIYLDDYAFSLRASSVGCECWIDFGVRLRHRWETWLELPEPDKEKE